MKVISEVMFWIAITTIYYYTCHCLTILFVQIFCSPDFKQIMAELQHFSGAGSVETVNYSSTLSSTEQDLSSQDSSQVPEAASAEVEVHDSSDITEETSGPIKLVAEKDQKTLFAVLQFLRKNNLGETVNALEQEAEKAGGEFLQKLPLLP